ncbi:hypothetical protein BT69DRAFT_1276483 [Atractiella rhizophila]|nr:hypothetical protein BT69DRAFT_1276483 [Atractiella rhizophila]
MAVAREVFDANVNEMLSFYSEEGRWAKADDLGPHLFCAGWKRREVNDFPDLGYLEKSVIRLRFRDGIPTSNMEGFDNEVELEEEVDESVIRKPEGIVAEKLQVSFWICYSKVYQCPCLFFTVTDTNGSSLEIQDLINQTNIFHTPRSAQLYPFNSLTPPTQEFQEGTMPFITLDEHPSTGDLCFSLHPCETVAFMEEMMAHEPDLKGRRWMEAWLSLVGNVIDLRN